MGRLGLPTSSRPFLCNDIDSTHAAALGPDSPLAAGSPLLALAEPALLLVAPALGAFGGVIGNRDAFNPHFLSFGFSLRGVKPGIAGYQFRHAVQTLFMNFHRRNQQVSCRNVGSTQQFTATGTFADGTTSDMSLAVR